MPLTDIPHLATSTSLDGIEFITQTLADAVGVGNKTWHAYLSTTGQGGVNARDRIGSGPWHNAKGVQVASDVDDLHSDQNKLSKENSIDEKGEVVNGRGDDPNRHDILTGSELDGTAFSGDEDTTCGNWTSNGEGSARVGHHDRNGGGEHPTSWNSAHGSRGCSQQDLNAVDTGAASAERHSLRRKARPTTVSNIGELLSMWSSLSESRVSAFPRFPGSKGLPGTSSPAGSRRQPKCVVDSITEGSLRSG